MEEIDIQNKLNDWQRRMDAKKAAEEAQRQAEAEKLAKRMHQVYDNIARRQPPARS